MREQIKERIQEYRDVIDSTVICYRRWISDNPEDENNANHVSHIENYLARIQELEWVLSLIPEKVENRQDSLEWFRIDKI